MAKQKQPKSGKKNRTLTEEQLLDIADKYFGGATYKTLKKKGYTSYHIKQAIALADKKWNLSSSRLNLRKLVQLAHRQKGIVTAEQLKKYSDYAETTYDTYVVRSLSIDDLADMYGDEFIAEKLAEDAYTPVVLEGVII